MNNEIKEILKDDDELLVYYNDNSFESFDTLPQNVLDYITNLQERLEVSQINEETYRLEMLDITKILGLDEHTTFDEVKEYATNLQEENERLNNKIKRIAYQCYESDMSYEEFKQIWVNAMGKIYEPSQIDELEKELKENK